MTLLELATVIVIIAILASLLFPAFSGYRARSDRIKCENNLRNIYLAASAYLLANGSWPQIPSKLVISNRQDYARRWVAALSPFGAPHAVWICPTRQRDLKQTMESVEEAENYRVDFAASPFDEEPFSPRRWARYPWFIEQGSFHAGGNLIVFGDGSIKATGDFLQDVKARR
jgi:type II secretory pathway pseudopilin PulG